MGTDAKEFITDVPGQKVRGRIIQALLEKGAARPMEFRLPVRGVQQDVGVDDQQSGLFHCRIQFGTIRHVHEWPPTAPGREHGAGAFPVRFGRRFSQNASQRRFHEFGDGRSPSGRLFAQPSHHGVVDVESRLHMENHIGYMDPRQAVVGRFASMFLFPSCVVGMTFPPFCHSRPDRESSVFVFVSCSCSRGISCRCFFPGGDRGALGLPRT